MRSVLACALLVIALAASPAQSQSVSEEVFALHSRAIELRRAGKYDEAIPLAERLAEALKTRGPDRLQYATALNELAHLLQATTAPTSPEQR